MTPTPDRPLDHDRLRAAVAAANLPTLVMVLFHLTGDRRWLRDPYRPSRTRGLGPNDAGGFDEPTAAHIRAEAVTAIAAWSRGAPVAVPDPGVELLREMLSTCVAEAVPDEYERLMREEMGFEPAPEPEPVPPERIAARDFRVVVIGAGASGLIAGVRLRAAGIPFVILERNADVGGVWLTNAYPGAGVDTPSYLYSFSFYRRNWSTHFGKRDEVAGYLSDMADHFGLREHIRFGVTVDELRYDEPARRWTVSAHGPDGGGHEYEATAVVSAVGLFHTPKVPELPGLGSFRGPIFHSARWPSDLDLTGKRVAVVGTGASAMQVVPAIADRVERLTVLQRSAQWIAPDEEYYRPIGPDVHWLMDRVPYYHAWYRFRLAWVFNDRVHPSLRIDPDWPHPQRSLNAVNDGHRRYFARHLRDQLADRPDLVEKCLPDYPPFGKRMLLDTGWYAALKRDNVELVAEGVREVTETGVVSTGGQAVDADVVVLATGFDAQRYPGTLRVTGRGGRTLREQWGEDDASAYLGICAPGFPNLFFMYGPNTNAGAGGSFIFIAEAQGHYIVDLVTRMARDGVGALECRPEAHRRWVADVDAEHARMVWSHPGMTTYYRNSRGRVVTNSPYRVVDYWAMTRDPDPADFVETPADHQV
ncbi:flavin-containing monooxygenase [Pseudonocardia acaciae]|uniref:flavin-containing monooxygenase n=1 Tax=Pseudonocardia acaciae TaxID=551276 RepID=UPI00048C1802|nr:NAD(P)/FAD-dependent oxidoreductase [Pseudonocardia acaciae]